MKLLHAGLQVADPFQSLLGRLVIVPEGLRQGRLLQFFYFLLFSSDVKGKPSSHSGCL